MARFAVGKNSYAISDRSGLRYRYKDMRREWNGLLVGKDEYEPKHPQLEPYSRVSDAIALKDARPDVVDPYIVLVGPPNFENPNLPRIIASGLVGQVEVAGDAAPVSNGGFTITSGLSATGSVGTPTVNIPSSPDVTYTITVAATGYGNKFHQNGLGPGALGVNINEGSTYRYDQSDSSNAGHPLRFSTTSDGTHAGGVEYTTGVTTFGTPGQAGAYTQITVAIGAPTLYTYCTNHSGMGYRVNTI